MGIPVKPSFKRHHGYRTRERPPTRQAHRSDGLAIRDPSRCRRRRPAPNKKPAATDAAGFEHGRFPFPRGMRCRRPPFAAAGGGACDAAGDRVLFSHSLPQGTSAGRNLITVFATVNNLSQFFFAPTTHPARRIASRSRMHDVRRIHASACMHSPECENTGKNSDIFPQPQLLRECSALPFARATALAGTLEASLHPHSPPRSRQRRCASHKPVCAKTARTFLPHRGWKPRRAARFTEHRTKKNSRHRPRVRVLQAVPGVAVSGLRLPAVRHSRPGRAVR